MKTFFVGLALGFGIGFLLLPRSGNEHDELIRERTRELQRAVPTNHQRELRNASIEARDRYSRPRRPAHFGAGAVRVGIHPVALLNMATEKQLITAGLEPQMASKIVAHRPYSSIQDAMDRGLLDYGTLALAQDAARAWESEEPAV
ncbi:MAG TPA: hypothetical protein VFU27_06755 [Terriglobales bacterium]|nr:hypothetical protein [Terriglobales bacterium]